MLVSCSDDCTAKVWAPADSTVGGGSGLLHDLTVHEKEIYAVAWTPAGPGSSNPDIPLRLCTASFDGSVVIWEPSTGTILHTLRRHNRSVYTISPSPDGLYLAAGSLGGRVSVWNIADGSLMREMRGSGDTFDVSWSSDGKMLSCCFSSGMVQVVHMLECPVVVLSDDVGDGVGGGDTGMDVDDDEEGRVPRDGLASDEERETQERRVIMDKRQGRLSGGSR
jgi:transducin (beta)-like 1